RQAQHGSGLERQDEAIGEEGGVERGEGLVALGVTLLDRAGQQFRPLGKRSRRRGEPNALRQRARLRKLRRELAIDQHEAVRIALEPPRIDRYPRLAVPGGGRKV